MMAYVLLGLIQGVAEWLPVSSEGLLVLAQQKFWPHGTIEDYLSVALFLHLGTVCSALVYFRRDIAALVRTALHASRGQPTSMKGLRLLLFLTVTTLLSGVLGLALLWVLKNWHTKAMARSVFLEGFIGVGLLITGLLLLVSNKRGHRGEEHISWMDMIVLGLVQGCAALPGLSRSGLTVSALLLRGFEKTTAIRLSFLMSVPLVLLGQIGLHWSGWHISPQALVACVTSFATGLLTIHLFLKLAQKIPFGWLVLLMGGMMLCNAWLIPASSS